MSEHDVKVSQLERELRFFPVPVSNPKRLTTGELAFFNEQGYLSGFRVFNQEEVNLNRLKSDALLERFIKEGKGSYAIDRYQDRFATIYDLATSVSLAWIFGYNWWIAVLLLYLPFLAGVTVVYPFGIVHGLTTAVLMATIGPALVRRARLLVHNVTTV